MASIQAFQGTPVPLGISNGIRLRKSHKTILPLSSPGSANETSLQIIATRLATETEFGEVEAAAPHAGKKVTELAEQRRRSLMLVGVLAQEEQTDPILLAEVMGMRTTDAESVCQSVGRVD